MSGASIAGGAGDDTFVFDKVERSLVWVHNTYFFGSDDGSDTLNFLAGASAAGQA